MGNSITSCMNEHNADTDIVLRVCHVGEAEPMGSKLTGFQAGDKLLVSHISSAGGLEPLEWRYREDPNLVWPSGYRTKSPRMSLSAYIAPEQGREQLCLLQVAESRKDQTLGNVRLEVEDGVRAAAHAHRFNLHMMQHPGNVASIGNHGETVPVVKVCVPVACEVISSDRAELRRGSICALSAYSDHEVSKFVYDGSEEFVEFPQAFFHFAAFSSAGSEFVCDIQGFEDDGGGLLLVDPLVLRSELPSVSLSSVLNTAVANMTGAAARDATEAKPAGATEHSFERLHPRCSQICKSFDPQRSGGKRNKNFCGFRQCGHPHAYRGEGGASWKVLAM